VAVRTRRVAPVVLFAAVALVPVAALAVMLPYTFVNGTVADATEVNANFEALAYPVVPRATELGPGDGTDVGPIASRNLTVVKDRPDTSLRITYSDNFHTFTAGGFLCRWEIEVDGGSCPSGALFYDYHNALASANQFESHTVTGFCDGLAAGAHTLQVTVGPGGGPPTDCFTGFNNSRWVLAAEEVY
jgi:hypothetical protein